MQDEMVQNTNAPVAVQKRRGRPCFAPSDEQRRAVTILASEGCSQVEIARRFRLSVPTLCKYFRFELVPPATPAPKDVKAKLLFPKKVRRSR